MSAFADVVDRMDAAAIPPQDFIDRLKSTIMSKQSIVVCISPGYYDVTILNFNRFFTYKPLYNGWMAAQGVTNIKERHCTEPGNEFHTFSFKIRRV